jgi:archaellum component FlaF (FlaF/FlaG flagellin family)
MGYGTVIAGIYFVAILLVSLYVYADSVNRLSTTSWKSLEIASEIESSKLRTALEISNIAVAANRTVLYVTVTNTGETKIAESDFAWIDVFLTYTDNTTGVTQTEWCHYNSSNGVQPRWNVNSTIAPNPFPAAVNPLDWDPSETLAIVIHLRSSNQFAANTDGFLKVVAPQGISAAMSFPTGD